MDIRLGVVVAVFPLIFFAELPDKTMFASLVMGSRGRPLAVWIGTAVAFLVHVVIAVTVGVAIFHLLPHRLVDLIVTIMFGVGAYLAFAATEEGEELEAAHAIASTKVHRVALTAFVVIFLAEWGDLTQVVTANLAARYHSPLSVGLGALLALWSVSAIAIVSGQGLMRLMPGTVLRRVTGVVCVILAIVALVEAIRG
jgi:putative Ca2+/H+ antiporter (TMEM165/GDT1 family)